MTAICHPHTIPCQACLPWIVLGMKLETGLVMGRSKGPSEARTDWPASSYTGP